MILDGAERKPERSGDLLMGEASVKRHRDDLLLRLPETGKLVGQHNAVHDLVRGASSAGPDSWPATSRSTLDSRWRARNMSVTLFLVMAISHPATLPRPGSKLYLLRHAATKTCWVTSSASGASFRDRKATV